VRTAALQREQHLNIYASPNSSNAGDARIYLQGFLHFTLMAHGQRSISACRAC